MKLATVKIADAPHWGVIEGEMFYDVGLSLIHI